MRRKPASPACLPPATCRTRSTSRPALRPAPAAWPRSMPSATSTTFALPDSAPILIDPDDLAAFRAAIAGAKPLAPSNRIEAQRPRPAPLPRPRRPGEDGPEARPAKRGEAPLPAFWNSEDPEVLRKRAANPELAAFHAAMNGVKPLPDRNRVELG